MALEFRAFGPGLEASIVSSEHPACLITLQTLGLVSLYSRMTKLLIINLSIPSPPPAVSLVLFRWRTVINMVANAHLKSQG